MQGCGAIVTLWEKGRDEDWYFELKEKGPLYISTGFRIWEEKDDNRAIAGYDGQDVTFEFADFADEGVVKRSSSFASSLVTASATALAALLVM